MRVCKKGCVVIKGVGIAGNYRFLKDCNQANSDEEDNSMRLRIPGNNIPLWEDHVSPRPDVPPDMWS